MLGLIWDIAILGMLVFCVVAIFYFYKRPRKITIILGLFFLLSFFIIAYGSFIEPRRIVINRTSISLQTNANTNDPIKIALLSDLHFGPYKGANFAKKIHDRLISENPDLVMIAGDFIYDETGLPILEESLRALNVDIPTYAVLGNHEYNVGPPLKKKPSDDERAAQVANAVKNSGITLLSNEYRLISARGKTFWLLGVDSWYAGHSDLKKSLSNTINNYPKILLAHTPDILLDIKPEYEINLILSAHTHGGQIRLPFWGPVPPLPTQIDRKYDKGYFTDTVTPLFITSGVGESGPRARLFNPPEIVILEISL